jgi:hypothetical protein
MNTGAEWLCYEGSIFLAPAGEPSPSSTQSVLSPGGIAALLDQTVNPRARKGPPDQGSLKQANFPFPIAAR